MGPSEPPPAEALAILKPFPGRFIHGVNLNDPYPVHNLALSERLFSPDTVALLDPGVAALHRSIRDVSLEELRAGAFQLGGITPRSTWCVWGAAIIRGGGHVGIGEVNTQWLGRQEMERILHLGNVELEFESVRRNLAPDSASRLACLWVADDTAVGQAHIRRMLGPSIHILGVTVPAAIRVTKADTGWFDAYLQNPDKSYIERYWTSQPCGPRSPAWEYLVEGIIKVDDQQGLDHLRQHGARL